MKWKSKSRFQSEIAKSGFCKMFVINFVGGMLTEIC